MAPQVATPRTAPQPAAPSKTPRPAPRRSFTWPGRLFLVAFALVLLVATAPWIVAATALRHQVLNWIVPELPAGTVVSSAQFGWLSPVLMNGIIVKDDNGRPLFSAESITSTSNIFELIKDPSKLGEFVIEKPVFNIVVGKTGSNVAPLAERLGKKPPKGKEMSVGVTLKDGTLTVSNEEGAKLAELTSLQAAYTSAPGEDPNHKVRLDCKVTHPVPDGEVHLAGQVHFVPATKETHGGELSATIKGFPLDVLQPALAESMHLTSLAGVTDIEFRTKLTPVEGGPLSTEVDLHVPRLQFNALRAGAVAPVRWANQAPIEFALRGAVDISKQVATIQSLGLNSEMGNLRVKGSIGSWTGDLDCDLTGEVDYDLRLLLAQLRPDIQDQIRLEGLQVRNIIVKGPLKRLRIAGPSVAKAPPPPVPGLTTIGGPAPAENPPAAPVPDLPVPGKDSGVPIPTLGEPAPLPGATGDGIVRGPLPGESAPADGAPLPEPVLPAAAPQRPLEISADLAWKKAFAFGVLSENGILRVSTQNNVLAADPVNVPVGTGRFRARPEIPLDREPLTAYLGPGPILDDVALTEDMCRTWLMYVSPLMSNATAVDGRFSLHMDNAVIPLGAAGQGVATGKLLMQEGRVGPGPLADEILRMVGPIVQAAGRQLNPDDMVWMNMPRQAIPFQMKDGRVTHGVMTFIVVGGVIVTSQGSVGTADRSLDLLLEFRLPEEWLNRGPILAALKGEALQIKVGGTLDKPQVDNKPFLEFGRRAGIKAGVGAIFKILENRQRRRGGP